MDGEIYCFHCIRKERGQNMKERPQEPYRIERIFLGEITAGEMISYIYRSYGGLSASAGENGGTAPADRCGDRENYFTDPETGAGR